MTGTGWPGPSDPPDMPGGSGSPPSDTGLLGRHGFVRPRTDRQVAGVCAAIARGTKTDPVLWRVLLAVGVLFGGMGLLAYLVGWLLMPEEGDTGSPLEALFGRGRSSTPPAATVLLLTGAGILLVVTVQWTPVAAAVIAGVGYLIYRQQQSAVQEAARHGPRLPSDHPTGPPPGPSPHPVQPPDLPPGPPPAPAGTQSPPRPRSRLGRVALFTTVLALGLVAVADLAGVSVAPSGYLATALAVTGTALVVGAWFGRARGMIGLGILLSLALAVTATVEALPSRGTGTRTWQPGSVSEITPSYQVSLGHGTLDLRDVDFTDQDLRMRLTVTAGDLKVLLPPDVDFTADLSLAYGNARLLSEEVSGASARRRITDLGADQVSGPGAITAHVTVKAGNLEVQR